jgi:hypothetical protein
LDNCFISFSNIYIFLAGIILVVAIYFLFKFKLFNAFILFLIFNSIVAWKTHLNEQIICFNFEKFFYIWRVLTIGEIPILVTFFMISMLLNIKNWTSKDKIKFTIVFLLWAIELFFVLKMFSLI